MRSLPNITHESYIIAHHLKLCISYHEMVPGQQLSLLLRLQFIENLAGLLVQTIHHNLILSEVEKTLEL